MAQCSNAPASMVILMTIATSTLNNSFMPATENVSMASANANPASSVMTPLSKGNEANVLSALSTPSLTNVIMSGFIRDNGLASPLNRGSFYACHNERNDLTGVALIGHTILFEALDEGAVQSFAALARKNSSNHLLMGERDAVRQFWNNYAVDGE